MALFCYDFEASGLLDEPDLYYHCGLFKQHHKNNFMLFLPLNDRTHYTEEDVETAKQFALNKQTIYKNCQVRVADFEYLEEWLTGHSDWSPTALACHNCFDYDQILMEKLSGIHFDLFEDKDCMGTINGHRVNLFDTLPMSRILWPDRPLPKGCPEAVFNPVTKKSQTVGPHGLMAWGYALGNQKVKIDDWRNLPLWKYVDRVWEDVIIQELLWDELIAESKGTFYGKSDMQNFMYDPDKEKPNGFKQITWKYALRRGMLQHFLMGLQARQGVYFDIDGAIALRQKCDDMMKEIADRVEPQLPLKEVSEAQKPKFPQKPFNTDGSISSHGYSWLKNKLGYPVNEAAFDFKPAPKRAFNKDGSVSATGIKWCEERGCTDPEKQADFLRAARSEEAPKPLPDDLMQQAIKDLQDKKMPDCMVPMRMSNQMDIKRYLISVGWQPTMWRTKDLTRDYHKKQLPDAEVDAKVREYMDELETSEYRTLIIRELNKDARFKTSEAKFLSRKNSPRVEQEVFAKFRRKARGLPTSPQLKDNFGHLCPNLAKLQGEMAKDIIFWLSLRNRRSVLDPIKEDKVDTGLLNHPRLQIDHRLPAESSGLTNTTRQKHRVIANFPKPSPKVVLGKEMRSLCTVPPGKYQLGVDGSNLEQLIGAWGAWEFDNGLYYRVVSEGDAHQNNAKAYSKVIGREVSRGDGKPITYACLPKDTTTVLTRDGWKGFKDLAEGMDVLTYNTKKGVSEWKPIQHVVEFDNQQVIKMENSHFKFESTADHRWFGDRRTGRKTKHYVQEFFTTEEFKGERRILRSAVAEGGDLDISPEEAGVLGWLVADGAFKWSGFKRNKEEGITARIVQSEKKYTEEIRQTLAGANISWSEHYSSDDRVDFLLCSKDIRKLFDKLPFGRVNKDEFPWTKLVLMLSQPARAAWLEAFYLAEGWTDRSGNKIICQNEGEYLEAVRLAIYLEGMVPVQHNHGMSSETGYASKGICRNLRLSDRKFLTCQRLTKAVSRNTDVFCLTTENSTFVARQGNHITITGNCLYGAQKDKIADMLDIPPDLGQSIIDALWDANPGLKGRKESLEKFWEATGKRFIYAFDGHAIWTRSKHSLLNAYQQNGGASLCDLVGLLVHRNLVTLKIDGETWYDLGVRRIIYYHDEFQYEIPDNGMFKTVYEFDTLEELEKFKAEEEAKGRIFTGNKYKKACKDENGEEVVDSDGKTVYDPILNENGKCQLIHCKVGEMVVKCFHQASRIMKAPFQISGEGLVGYSWGDTH